MELFSSGFNNNSEKYCSLFPDIEYKLGSIGRFQDIEIYEGKYQINPPFQTTMIYEILRKIKSWIDNGNKNNKKLEFHLFIPDWLENSNNLKYSEYKIYELLDKIDCKKNIINKNNMELDYIDYWNNKIRNNTLPNTLYIIIKNFE